MVMNTTAPSLHTFPYKVRKRGILFLASRLDSLILQVLNIIV